MNEILYIVDHHIFILFHDFNNIWWEKRFREDIWNVLAGGNFFSEHKPENIFNNLYKWRSWELFGLLDCGQ